MFHYKDNTRALPTAKLALPLLSPGVNGFHLLSVGLSMLSGVGRIFDHGKPVALVKAFGQCSLLHLAELLHGAGDRSRNDHELRGETCMSKG